MDQDIAALTDLLTKDERERADRFRRQNARNQFIVAHGFARLLLGRMIGAAPAAVIIESAPGEKPRVAGHSRIDFSLTHTRGLAAFAAAIDRRVGLDAECLNSTIAHSDIAEWLFTSTEAELVEQFGRDAFFRLWTLKESFLKATADGLRRPLRSVEFRLAPPGLRHLASDDQPCHFAQWLPTVDHVLSLSVEGGSYEQPPIIDVCRRSPPEVGTLVASSR